MFSASARFQSVQLQRVVDRFEHGTLLIFGQRLDLLQPPENLAAWFPGLQPFVFLTGINRSSVVTTETYGYTPDNKRVYRKEPNGTVVTYAYGVFGERLAAFSGTNGDTLGRNVYFGSKLIATQGYANGVLTAPVLAVGLDRVGSVRVDNSTFTYYSYGEEYSAVPEDAEKFATYFRDSASRLDYAKNRYYSSMRCWN